MTEINLKKQLLDADGKDQGIELGAMLSDLIMQSTITDCAFKFFEWGIELKKSGKIKLDTTDKVSLVDYINKHQTLFTLPKGRLLQEINK